MQKYKIVVSYDGTDYFGWQKQKTLPTIAGTLEDRFFSVFGKKILLLGVSRTDAGVHALGQLAQFTVAMQINSQKILNAWNNLLPSEIVIRSIEKVDDSFNLHRGIYEKIYHYNFFIERPLPNIQRYGWYFRYPVNIKKLQDSLNVFVGTHDFRSFCTGYEREDTVRTINSVSVEFVDSLGFYRIAIHGPKFLRHMVRRIVGACIEVSSRDFLSIEDLKEAIERRDPHQRLPNAPAKGLFLDRIIYKN